MTESQTLKFEKQQIGTEITWTARDHENREIWIGAAKNGIVISGVSGIISSIESLRELKLTIEQAWQEHERLDDILDS